MPIRKDVIIRSKDGDDYRFMGLQWKSMRTGRTAKAVVRIELENLAIKMGYIEGDGIFGEILEQSILSGYIPERNAASRKWMQDTAKEILSVNRTRSIVMLRSEVISESRMKTGGIRIGRPIIFRYDAKFAQELPYYDQFPIVIPISTGTNKRTGEAYFIGLNLHYLDYKRRGILLDALYSVRQGISVKGNLVRSGRGTIPMLEESYGTIFDISYAKLLNSISKFDGYKPTIHKYLVKEHIKSRIIDIPPNAWTMMFFLPLAQFSKGVSLQKVYDDSNERG